MTMPEIAVVETFKQPLYNSRAFLKLPRTYFY